MTWTRSNGKCPLTFLAASALSLTIPLTGCSGCSESTLHGQEDGSGDTGLEPDNAADVPDTWTDTGVDTYSDPISEIPSEVVLDLPDPVDGYDPDLPPLPYVPQCGNGIIDPGEECDDRNRLNGDGCDWLCQIGDGDDPPEPDPTWPPYVPDGPTVTLVDEFTETRDKGKVPLVWTGSQYATAYYVRPEETYYIRFIRFDVFGHLVDAGWAYGLPEPSDYGDDQNAGLDLVWTGDRFALFFAEMDRGILLMFLDANGKPLGSPVLVEPDPVARAPSASQTSDGFVLVWSTIEWPPPSGSVECGEHWGGPLRSTRMRLLAADGSTTGFPGPILLEENPGLSADVVAGDIGFGIVSGVNVTEEHHECSFRFIRSSLDLSSLVFSGYLSDGAGGEVVWHDDHYMTAWTHEDDDVEETVETCVARFTSRGDLARPPVCDFAYYGVGSSHPINTRLDAGIHGLGIIYAMHPDEGGAFNLFFLATDSIGAAVADDYLVTSDLEPFTAIYAIKWATDAFGVMFETYGHIQFQRFMAE